MKKIKLLFWIPTTIIFLFEGVLVLFTFSSQTSIDGITSLGYPVYFVTLLAVFKILGSIALMFPQVPHRIREWAYAGFAIDFISAFISIWVVAGIGYGLILPLVFMALLVLSYVYYHKTNPCQYS